MATSTPARKRTAVLVVHGMGSQRPLETTRGVVDAVWLGGNHTPAAANKIWTHPERGGGDINLPVITTNFIAGTHRRTDFHELYWAHQMSETRAVAVLLWLFELARSGPRLKPSIGALYWVAVVFLSLLALSISLLTMQFVLLFAARIPGILQTSPFVEGPSITAVMVFAAIVVAVAGVGVVVAVFERAWKLVIACFVMGAFGAGLFLLAQHFVEVPVAFAVHGQGATETVSNLLLPVVLAAAIVFATMDGWGLAGLAIAIVLSYAAVWFGLWLDDIPWLEALHEGWMPWSVSSHWSSLAAFFFIAMYLALYGAFLQPYLGDAARYFRNSPANVAVRRDIRKQAVDVLESLHRSEDYDRIVVVAHSLGTVVAYDMLRAYYSDINGNLPDVSLFGSSFDPVDQGTLPKDQARAAGRDIVRSMAEAIEAMRGRRDAKTPNPGDDDLRAWLVTDFVSMGSPLTHALYLMCRGKTEAKLKEDFERRTREREFPTCPPRKLDGDGLLTFVDPNGSKRRFHHGGQFALTRWTNLYFPVSQLLWGDAIGGPVGDIFGDPVAHGSNVADVPVFTNAARKDNFFAHILYWCINLKEGIATPHIEALQKAIDLADAGTANGM